jgi:hypothetical protein
MFIAPTLPMFCADNALTSVARIFISLLVTFSYPLQCHPARRCVTTIVQQCLRRADTGCGSDAEPGVDSTHASAAWDGDRVGPPGAVGVQGYAGVASSPGKATGSVMVADDEYADSTGTASNLSDHPERGGGSLRNHAIATKESDSALFMLITVSDQLSQHLQRNVYLRSKLTHFV